MSLLDHIKHDTPMSEQEFIEKWTKYLRNEGVPPDLRNGVRIIREAIQKRREKEGRLCYELARAFLRDEPDLDTLAHADQLAQDIQDAVETYIEWAKRGKEE